MPRQVAHVWDVQDGKAVRFQQYVDTAPLQHVLEAKDAHATADAV